MNYKSSLGFQTPFASTKYITACSIIKTGVFPVMKLLFSFIDRILWNDSRLPYSYGKTGYSACENKGNIKTIIKDAVNNVWMKPT